MVTAGGAGSFHHQQVGERCGVCIVRNSFCLCVFSVVEAFYGSVGMY
jgi:hypothetical protein